MVCHSYTQQFLSSLPEDDLAKFYFTQDLEEFNKYHSDLLAHSKYHNDGAPVYGFCVMEDVANFQINGRDVLAGNIFIVRPDLAAPEWKQLEWNSLAIHELAHSNGAN
jgi:hypothetical protein